MKKQNGGVKIPVPVEDLDPNLEKILINRGIRYNINLVRPHIIAKINRMQPWNKWLSFMKDFEKSGIIQLTPEIIDEVEELDVAQIIDKTLQNIGTSKYDYKNGLRRKISREFIRDLRKTPSFKINMFIKTNAVLDVVIDYVSSLLNDCE